MVARVESIGDALFSPAPAVDPLALPPGRVVGLEGPPGFGLTRLGLAMMADTARRGLVAFVDVRGWLCPPAAWESGIAPERLVVVRCADAMTWGRVVAGLLDGMHAVYAEVPPRVKEAHLRKLAAASRSTRTPLVLRPVHGELPGGVAHLRLSAREIVWDGTDRGFGRLTRRRLVIEASGKVMQGMARLIEVEDHGTHAVRVVSGLGAAPAGHATG
jgi:hypothetical protein